MTDKELKDLVASLTVSQAWTDKQMKETDKQMKEMIKSFSYLKENVDGISKTTGQEAQEFFYTSFKKNKKINNIEFDSISANLGVAKNGKKHEIDIFLENGNSVGIIEVKNKVKEKDLEQLQKIVDSFYYFHPSFKEYKIIPAIAGKIFPEHLQNKALKSGFVVVTQVGNHTEQIAPI
ncbi:MAG: hypothetical protein U9R27_11120 [Campylobacterota bacterium]|nr:hypothetical protein [Campylobacterota bacterium]